jgi:4,5-dihydroxyphthalate decarboxylase
MLEIRVVARGYDSLYPLYRGVISTPGVAITLDHSVSIDTVTGADPPPAGEMSLSRYLLAVAGGDDSWVGLPIYLIRGFRHRSFWVRADSAITSLSELHGARVGVSGWADTGNTWARAAMRDAGVGMDDVHWRLGAPYRGYPRAIVRPEGPAPARGLTLLDNSDTLVDATVRGELDAVSLAFPPPELFGAGAPLRRLVPDYRAAEQDYLERTGLYPIFHILALRRDVFTAHPHAALSLYEAFAASWRVARDQNQIFGDATPWMQYEMEHADRLLGAAAVPFGLTEPVHRRSIDELAQEQAHQRLTDRPTSAPEAFADFLKVAGIGPHAMEPLGGTASASGSRNA